MGFLDSIKNKKYVNAIHAGIKDMIYIEKHIPDDFDPHKHEPSTIYMELPVSEPDVHTKVPPPDYFPSYATLTREQRYEYLRFLKNPYSRDSDTGYFFCFFYGLERQLYCGNFERAFEITMRMRNVCENQSFQYYTAKSLIFSCLRHKSVGCLKKIIENLHDVVLDINIFLLAKSIAQIPFTFEDLFLYRQDFGDTSKLLPERKQEFKNKLRENMIDRIGSESIDLDFLTDYIVDLSSSDITVYANMSLQHITAKYYLFSDYDLFFEDCSAVIEKTRDFFSKKKIASKPKISSAENVFKHGECLFNEEEETFYQTLLSKLSHLYKEKDIECWTLSDKTINFNGPQGQIGRVKLRGRKLKMQIIDSDNCEWIEIADLDDAIARIPEWVKYEEEKNNEDSGDYPIAVEPGLYYTKEKGFYKA